MCRWIAYSGQQIFIEQLITLPEHSLVEQSMKTEMNYDLEGNLMHTNGDGFGVGWYADKPVPGLFREKTPAWSNDNLREICGQVKANIFFAHVRATTAGSVQNTNCHPFKYKNWLFQHNGDVAAYDKIRRDLQMDLTPEMYNEIKGTTDSETFFLMALSYGLMDNPKEGLKKMVKRVKKAMDDHKVEDQYLNLSCAISDGKKIYTLRYAIGKPSKTQFYCTESHMISGLDEKTKKTAGNIIVVSEPLDRFGDKWTEIPHNSFTTIENGKVTIEKFMDE